MTTTTSVETLTLAGVADGARDIVRPRERLSVSEWAKRHFFIREPGAVQPGPYDLSWTPYWREPLDCLARPDVRRVNVVAAAQTGKTQLGNVGVAYWCSQSPTNMLYVRPTEADVLEAFRDRFRPMIEANLREMLPPGDWMVMSRNPAILLRNCTIYGAAATVARQLTSRTTPRVWYDETDTAEESANSLGDVLALLDERQMAASGARSITLGTSTPKRPDGANWQGYQNSDAREYWEPCPVCGAYQPLAFGALRTVDAERDPQLIREHDLGYFECVHCHEAIEPQWQAWMADRGRWVERCRTIEDPLPLSDAEVVERASLETAPVKDRWEPARGGEPSGSDHRGYRVWRANTKFEQCGWSNIIARWFEMYENPSQRQVFINNWRAEPYQEAIDSAGEDVIEACRGEYPASVVPSRAKIVLASIDVQTDSVWYSVRAFGPAMESWLVEYGQLQVMNQQFEVTLNRFYQRAVTTGWPVAGSDDGDRMRAYAIAVDSGFRTDDVYRFARNPGVIPLKGHQTADFRVRVSQVEHRNVHGAIHLYHCNVKAMRDRLQRLIRGGGEGMGRWWIHADASREYISQMTSEHLVNRSRQSTTKVWRPKSQGRPNHLLDCETYILALAEAIEMRGEYSVAAVTEDWPAVGVTPGRPRRSPTPAELARASANQGGRRVRSSPPPGWG